MKKTIHFFGFAALLVMLTAQLALAQNPTDGQDRVFAMEEKPGIHSFGPQGPMAPGDDRAMAAGRKGMRPMGMPKFWKSPDQVEALGLTEDQLNALDDLDWKYREMGVDLHGQMQKAQLALEKAMKDATDEGAVKKAAKAVSSLHEQMFMMQLDHQLEIRKILSDDQWKKLQAMPPAPKRGHGQRGGQRNER